MCGCCVFLVKANLHVELIGELGGRVVAQPRVVERVEEQEARPRVCLLEAEEGEDLARLDTERDGAREGGCLCADPGPGPLVIYIVIDIDMDRYIDLDLDLDTVIDTARCVHIFMYMYMYIYIYVCVFI